MAATPSTGKSHARSCLPHVNCFDLPELMPGAQASATPAQRENFEQRCRELYAVGMEDQIGSGAVRATFQATVKDLEDMFPCLDPALICALIADAGSTVQAMETLLALAASAAEAEASPLPPKEIGLDDIDSFPSLVDADGWQLPSQMLFERNPEADLGSVWCDRAKVVALMPAPAARSHHSTVSKFSRMAATHQHDPSLDEHTGSEALLPETEHDVRRRRGEQRIHNRTRFHNNRRISSTTGVPARNHHVCDEVLSVVDSDQTVAGDATAELML